MDLNRIVSNSLRIGVFASVVLSLAGFAAWAAGGYHNLNPSSGASISSTLSAAFHGDPSGIIYLAVAVLIATPVFRVAVSSLYFTLGKDGKYVLITLAVLSMLLFALFSGFTS